MPGKDDFSELLAEMLPRMDRQNGHIQQTNEILRTVVDVQNRTLNQIELMNTRHLEFAKRQEQFMERQELFNTRQEDVNLGLLHELRAIRTDVREVKDVVINDHEERLRRLEEFMRRAS